MSDNKIHLEMPIKQSKKSGLPSFFVILFGLGAFFISPAPDYLFSLIPDKFIKLTIAPIYQDITLRENPKQLSTPQKYMNTKPLPVLGRNTGVCFIFDKDGIDKKNVKLAKQGKIIAEIIVTSKQNKEYIMDEVTLDKNTASSIICQKFSRKHSLIPEQVKAVYVRPIKPLTPSKITWKTMKELH